MKPKQEKSKGGRDLSKSEDVTRATLFKSDLGKAL